MNAIVDFLCVLGFLGLLYIIPVVISLWLCKIGRGMWVPLDFIICLIPVLNLFYGRNQFDRKISLMGVAHAVLLVVVISILIFKVPTFNVLLVISIVVLIVMYLLSSLDRMSILNSVGVKGKRGLSFNNFGFVVWLVYEAEQSLNSK